MRIFWFSLLVLVVCAPMTLVALLFAEVRLPALDGLTMREPASVRETIAEMAANNAGYGKDAEGRIDRVLRLDPQNPAAWTRRCEAASADGGRPEALEVCQHAAGLDTASSIMTNVGFAQERRGSYCEARKSFSAASGGVSGDDPDGQRNIGRSALLCGESSIATVELNLAAQNDAKGVADSADDDDDKADYEADLKLDHEWLTVAYLATKQPELASRSCASAHPEWKACECHVDHGKVSCADAAVRGGAGASGK